MANSFRTYTRYAAIADTITITNINPEYNQLFVAAKYYSNEDFAEGNAVIPTGGTIDILGRANGSGAYGNLHNADVEDAPLDCTAAGNVMSTNIPLDSIQCIPSSITGATHYRITVSAKEV